MTTMVQELQAAGPDLRRVVDIATERFAAHVAGGDFELAERWAALTLGIVAAILEAMRPEHADG